MKPFARICVACRTAYDDGDSCDGGDGHEVVSLDDPEQRARLVERVWGDREQRARSLRKGRAQDARGQRLVLTAGAVGFLSGVSLAPTAGLLGALGGGVVGGIVAHVARPREPSAYPVGAAPRDWPRPSGRGRVRASGDVESPASGESCAAWALELRYDGTWGERVMLRAGASAGLEIALDGGEVLRIAAGPLVLAETAQQVDDLAAARIAALVHALDPLGVPAEVFAPVPYNVVAEAMLFVGERVEVLGVLDRVIAGGIGDGALYRDAPTSRLAPHGVPVLRRY